MTAGMVKRCVVDTRDVLLDLSDRQDLTPMQQAACGWLPLKIASNCT